jgi:2-oxoglutarate ferredoxin oxidoreductase subunit beta
MNTFGFHTIHGRAPAFATGLKLANPKLSVWQITGDGDGLSIGGNHLLHVLRRNVDLQILLFNNRIYGLTKGQYSPTSEVSKVTKSTPMGSIDHPVEPCKFALGCDASFVARTVDIDVKKQRQVLRDAYYHKGTSFVEILQNCNIFNDGAFENVSSPKTRSSFALYCTHGEYLTFGPKKGPKSGMRVTSKLTLEIVPLRENPTEDELKENNILIHDETNQTLALLLSQLKYPVAMGVLYRVPRLVYEEGVYRQIEHAQSEKAPDILKTLYSGNTWVVE